PLSVNLAPDDDRQGYVRAALQYLWERLDVLRFDGDPDAPPEDWVLRSRIAETVRLLSKLRQRLPPKYDGEKQRQRISKAKRLTGDVTFHVAPRRVPRRYRVPLDYLAVLDSSTERVRCANLLRAAIAAHLPKLRKISQFQEDALREILQAIELSPTRGA